MSKTRLNIELMFGNGSKGQLRKEEFLDNWSFGNISPELKRLPLSLIEVDTDKDLFEILVRDSRGILLFSLNLFRIDILQNFLSEKLRKQLDQNKWAA